MLWPRLFSVFIRTVGARFTRARNTWPNVTSPFRSMHDAVCVRGHMHRARLVPLYARLGGAQLHQSWYVVICQANPTLVEAKLCNWSH
jgi:hypothetical protein